MENRNLSPPTIVARFDSRDDPGLDRTHLYLPAFATIIDRPTGERVQYEVIEHWTDGRAHWHPATICKAFGSAEDAMAASYAAKLLDGAYQRARNNIARHHVTSDKEREDILHLIAVLHTAMQAEVDALLGGPAR